MTDQPAEKPTVAIAVVPTWAIELTQTTKDGIASLRADIGLVANDVTITKDRVAVIEGRVLVLEDARKTNSLRAQGASQIDMEHEAKLAQALSALAEEKAHRESLEQNSATKDDLKKVADAQTGDIVRSLTNAANTSPTVRNLMLAVAGMFLVAVNAVTVYLTRPPPPPPQQPTSITVTK